MSRPKLNMPLKEQNSPRSQWISNVSLLKNQLKDGELVVSSKRKNESTATKLTWNELEAQLGKRMREKTTTLPTINTNQPKPSGGGGGNNPLSPTSSTLNLIPHPRHSPTRGTTVNAPLPPGVPASPSKRPTLHIPTSQKSQDVLKQVHNGTAQLPPANRSPTNGTTSRTKLTKTKDPIEASRIDTKSTPRIKKTTMDADGSYHESKQSPLPPADTATQKLSEKSTPTMTMKEHISDVQPSPATTNDMSEVEGNLKGKMPFGIKSNSDKESVASSQQAKPRIEAKESQQHHQQPQKNKVPRPETNPSKTKGTMSWLRRTLKPNSSRPTKRSITMSSMTAVSILTSDSNHSKSSSSKNGYSSSSVSNMAQKVVVKHFNPTTPLQLLLWLSEVQKAVRLFKLEQQQQQEVPPPQPPNTKVGHHAPMLMVDALPPSPQQRKADTTQFDAKNQPSLVGDGTVGEGEDVYFHKNRDVGVYVDYSTFDDGDSVSSIELLFKWLTCRELNDTATVDNNSRQGTVMTPPGTVIATESNVSDDISIDLDARPTRRTFFSR